VAKTACLDVERGGQIIIGDDCEVRHHAVLEVSGRYDGSIEIGNHSVIGIGNWLQGSGRIRIGDNVIIGPYVAIVSTNHTYQDVDTPVAKQPLQTGEVVIEDDVWIGAHCTITQNVRIGAHSIIGANSFVNKDVPPYSIVGGAPAKLLKSRK
jgi:acetyltransferase-like isoleucine patch superfamily enzyme